MSLKTRSSASKASSDFSSRFIEQIDTEEHVPRLAIAEDGKIAYASASFCRFVKHPLEDLVNHTIFDVITFLTHGPEKKADLKNIHTGLHHIAVKGSSETYPFSFDWITLPENKRYLIGSAYQGFSLPSLSPESRYTDTPFLQPRPQPLPSQTTFLPEDCIRLFNLSRHIMVITDLKGQLLQANSAFYEVFGGSPAQAPVLSFFEALDFPDKTAFWEHTLQAPENTLLTLETPMVSQQAGLQWMAWQVMRTEPKLYWVGHDTTAIKNQQKALNNREKQLGEAESIGRMGHWTWTLGEEALDWSDEIYRIFGVEKGHFIPTLESMNNMVHRNDVSRVNQAFQRALIEENDYDMEFRLTRPDGETRHIRCEGRCGRDTNGEVHALYGIMQDMTERVLYEEKLREAKDTAERAYAAKTQFLANMSHELRTPLNAIIGFSELIERQLLGPIGTEKYLEYISGIRESGEHLLDLISDILDMSKIEAGKYALDLESLVIGKLVKLAVHMMEGRAQEAKITLKVDPALNEDRKIVADRRAILQILLNLLSNAVKFSHENGTVEIQCLEREQTLLIKITDHGIGIPASKLNSITKPFEQVSSSYIRNHEGSGLGLSITKELVEMHGGALLIDSTLGSGTTVTVRLPYEATASKEAPSE